MSIILCNPEALIWIDVTFCKKNKDGKEKRRQKNSSALVSTRAWIPPLMSDYS